MMEDLIYVAHEDCKHVHAHTSILGAYLPQTKPAPPGLGVVIVGRS